ncbi:MAG: hypothetical protein K2X80_08610 [Pseudomonadaceae bacterium]|nr:hypothetical protein [Pseudomonadaceae bacterium]
MSEPGPLTALGGIALYKLGAFGFVAVLAAIVVMAMTLPKTVREFGVSLICTVMGSICGGAGVVSYLGIGSWANDGFGLMALLGISFVCGLPAWLIIRTGFIYAELRKNMSLLDVIAELRSAIFK